MAEKNAKRDHVIMLLVTPAVLGAVFLIGKGNQKNDDDHKNMIGLTPTDHVFCQVEEERR
jgi:hypothetical protein